MINSRDCSGSDREREWKGAVNSAARVWDDRWGQAISMNIVEYYSDKGLWAFPAQQKPQQVSLSSYMLDSSTAPPSAAEDIGGHKTRDVLCRLMCERHNISC